MGLNIKSRFHLFNFFNESTYLANINVRWGEFELDDLREMRFEQDEMDRYGLKYGDIVMCEGREPGRCAIWKDQIPGMMIQKALHRIRPRNGLDNRFLFYSFLHKGKVGAFSPLFTGSTIKHLPRQQLAKIEIDFPELDVQRRIADILSAYDDLIENNRRRMALLEEAARQLYREWFVSLRLPGHENAIISNGLPLGWERKNLGSCSQFFSGGTPSKARNDFWNGEIPWVSSGELTSMRISDTPLRITPEAAAAGSRIVSSGTILAVVRGMSLAKEFRLGIAAKSVSFNQDLKAIVANSDIDSLFLFHSLESQRNQIRDKAGEASHGTKKLDTPVLAGVDIILPPERFQRLFSENVAPLHAQWDLLDRQSKMLRTARDLLLPRLMSGEIAV